MQKSELRWGSPLRWYGGKSRFMRWLRQWFPKHDTYVSLFGGGAADLISKYRSPKEIYNDLDEGAVNFFAQMRDNVFPLMTAIKAYNTSLRNFQAVDSDPEGIASSVARADGLDLDLERAAIFYFQCRASYSGESSQKRKRSYGLLNASKLQVYLNKIEALPRYSKRFRNVQTTNLDFEEALKRYDGPDTLHYGDPPYPPEMRTNRGQLCYHHEMNEAEHQRLLDCIRSAKGMVIVSSYVYNFLTGAMNDQYLDALADWTQIRLPCKALCGKWNRNNTRTDDREEVIWLNERARMQLAEHGSDLLRERHK